MNCFICATLYAIYSSVVVGVVVVVFVVVFVVVVIVVVVVVDIMPTAASAVNAFGPILYF